MEFKIRRITPQDYGNIRMLDSLSVCHDQEDETVDDPDWAIFAKELQYNGFEETDKVLSFQKYGFMH